jgi:hypothetical protein
MARHRFGSSWQQLLSPRGRWSGSEAQKPESDSVKPDYLKSLKHRLAESRYAALGCFGEVPAVAALVRSAQTSCVSI